MSQQLRQLVKSPIFVSFLRSREVRNFASLLLREKTIDPQTGRLAPEIQAVLGSDEFKTLIDSQLGPSSLNKPLKGLFSEQVLGVWQKQKREGDRGFGDFLNRFGFGQRQDQERRW